jgi:Helix-turn-helix domain of resolvase
MIGSNLHKVAEYPSTHGRPKKFTPERIQQIINLVERGRSPAEIAELIGVSVGSLAVTCSRLGISLRRPPLNSGVRLLRPSRPVATPSTKEPSPEPTQTATGRRLPRHNAEAAADNDTHNDKPALAEFTIELKYKGKKRAYQLSLTSDMIKRLALEAELRSLTMGELINLLMVATLKNIPQCEEADSCRYVQRRDQAEGAAESPTASGLR